MLFKEADASTRKAAGQFGMVHTFRRVIGVVV